MLFEGLSRNWGFYFAARTRPEAIGSSDLEVLLRNLGFEYLARITDENRETAPSANLEVASRRSLLLLYARYICFRVFLQCAAAMRGGITEDHKGRWLLIQVAPLTLFAQDIFLSFTKLLGRASKGYLETAIEVESLVIERLLAPPSTLFCVLDEAQIPANKFSDCFLSDTEPGQGQPILREIVRTWRLRLPNLIVTGTGVSIQGAETVISSAVATEGTHGPLVTETGGFDDGVGQRAYLERYLPPGFLDTPLGKEIESRAGYWLRGRFVFNAPL